MNPSLQSPNNYDGLNAALYCTQTKPVINLACWGKAPLVAVGCSGHVFSFQVPAWNLSVEAAHVSTASISVECAFPPATATQAMARAACSHLHLVPTLFHPLKSNFLRNQTLLRTAHFYGTQRRFSSFSSRISMSLRAGIVGLPNVGKSTLFNAVVENGKAQAANFPFCTIEPNVGIVAVPDSRLQGLGNKFLSHIREVDSILQVVRCFEDNDIVHVNGKVDPKSDIDVINLELVFADLDQIDKRLEKLKKGKAKDSQSKVKEEAEKSALEKIREALLDGKPARSVTLTDYERDAVKHLCLLTMKPVIYVANVAESDLSDAADNNYVKEVTEVASELQSGIVTVSAQVEAELTELPMEERQEYLNSLGVSESGLGNLIRETYGLLGLRTYFTSGEKETKAWTILAGMTAPQAAGVIHSDFEKGFIRAETVSIKDVAYDDFVAAGSLAAAREKGLLRSEGKDYIVQEGDVMLFRFNV
ncbi:uncharacterized protein LOC107630622 isoform X3 [Arachis ipaensis]|uniref:uncharacterized protein LOC107630622 isoform X3 n=1 Tax=Arachis ipaensis TaxID=130454 RepID=UPI000A2B131F|nr:uncharacterized protein LOC107630622 isoform X3 [Arachis ipaensis]XP_025636808.1 uncharacterized protein LOC112732335 isoform X3 [Arachis hypogaea]